MARAAHRHTDMAGCIEADRPCCCRRQIDVPTSDPWTAIINTLQVGIAAPTIDFISHPQRWTKGVTIRFLFAAQLRRLATAGRIAARPFLIIRCLWNDFLFQTKWLRAALLSVLPSLRNKNPVIRSS